MSTAERNKGGRPRVHPIVPLEAALAAPKLIGVCYSKKDRIFRAQVTKGLETIWLGAFGDPIEAARVRDAKVRELGLKTPLNFPDPTEVTI